jgi:hypothetical protein
LQAQLEPLEFPEAMFQMSGWHNLLEELQLKWPNRNADHPGTCHISFAFLHLAATKSEVVSLSLEVVFTHILLEILLYFKG